MTEIQHLDRDQLGPVGVGGEKQTCSSNGTIHFLKVRNKACHQMQLPDQLEILLLYYMLLKISICYQDFRSFPVTQTQGRESSTALVR